MRIAEISSKMKHINPVFIVGEARSGTSVLYRTLQKHSSFRPKEINLVESRILSYSSKTHLLRNSDQSNPFRYMLNDQFQFEQFLASIKNIQRIHQLLWPSINFKLSNWSLWWWSLNLNHLVLRSFFYFSKKARSAMRIIEKTPKTLGYSSNLKLSFPNCKLLYIYRHPIDVYTSYIRRGQVESQKNWLKPNPNTFCRMYKRDLDLALKFQSKMKESLLLIKYEDFTQNTENEFFKICTFIEEPLEKEAIIEKNPNLEKWKPDPHLFGSITSKTKNWRDYASLEDAKYIENELSSMMEKLSYERYSAHHSSK